MSWFPLALLARWARRTPRPRLSAPARRQRTRWRETLETLAFMLVVSLVWIVVPVQASV